MDKSTQRRSAYSMRTVRHRLRCMLADDCDATTVRWSSDGSKVEILEEARFRRTMLRRYFPTYSLNRFYRMLANNKFRLVRRRRQSVCLTLSCLGFGRDELDDCLLPSSFLVKFPIVCKPDACLSLADSSIRGLRRELSITRLPVVAKLESMDDKTQACLQVYLKTMRTKQFEDDDAYRLFADTAACFRHLETFLFADDSMSEDFRLQRAIANSRPTKPKVEVATLADFDDSNLTDSTADSISSRLSES